MPDPADVMAVGKPDDGDAVLGGALDPALHRLVAHHLTETGIAVERQERARIVHHGHMFVDLQISGQEHFDVARQHADTVGVVAGQVGLDQVIGDQIGLTRARTGSGYDRPRHRLEGFGADCHVGCGLSHSLSSSASTP